MPALAHCTCRTPNMHTTWYSANFPVNTTGPHARMTPPTCPEISASGKWHVNATLARHLCGTIIRSWYSFRMTCAQTTGRYCYNHIGGLRGGKEKRVIIRTVAGVGCGGNTQWGLQDAVYNHINNPTDTCCHVEGCQHTEERKTLGMALWTSAGIVR